jgi:RIO kinase 1
MNPNDLLDFLNDLDDNEQTNNFVNRDKRPQRFPPRNPKKIPDADRRFVHAQDDSRQTFKFTYKAARFEEGWLLNSLGGFYEHKWIADVLRKVKAGKEASVYLCLAGEQVDAPLVAAKVYRPRTLRSLKNDALYREGRTDLDSEGHHAFKENEVHAISKRTAFGEELRHQSWIAYEFTTLQKLFTAGADIPKPYEMANNAILMGFIGDEQGSAPALNEVSLDKAEARGLFDRVIHNVDVLLAHDCVHGDLSAYNILYWDGGITLIDFPQVISPQANRNAFRIFERDVTRVCEYFAKQGVRHNPRTLAAELWTGHGHRVTQEVHPKLLDADDERDRKLWRKIAE